ncbi:MAG: peptide chain release factor 1 [Acetomicrobium sp.]|jgi:peptide chain release factor 1|uniref:peptide chain release factor 1 n=1 Tax=Acetomicrobium sp. TaxID=1872099 RepID=UPI002872010F|nr:peptide chain release factor 1 [Acetomicrobium sp.]MDR9770932.1 peptide chain release factor 1 [Acetomicrobium sp.]
MENINEKLDELEKKFKDLELKLSDPEVISNPAELQRLAKEHAELSKIVEKYREYKEVLRRMEDAMSLCDDDDEELRELAKEEVAQLKQVLETLEEELAFLLLPKDPDDDKSVIVEIRAGAGGEEAALFAADLYRMYVRYAERKGWKVELITANETGIGGYKEIVFRVEGRGAYSVLKYESGVHRVQRVPITEAGGRIHTSTATVAVLPEPDEVDVEIRPEDLRIDTYRASGAGGQHVNMTDSAVRITHIPTGIVVTCQDERSQIKNRAKAMQLLRAKLYDLELRLQHEEMAMERRGQIGSGDRSERIRTYNFPQGRVTDHRIGLTLYNLEEILDGDLDELIFALATADQMEKLKLMGA